MSKLKDVFELDALREELRSETTEVRPVVTVAGGTCGNAQGAKQVMDEFVRSRDEGGYKDTVEIRSTGCQGFCGIEPLVLVKPLGSEEVLYCHVKADDVPQILSETARDGKVIERLLFRDPETGERYESVEDIPFYKHQTRTVSGKNRDVDPIDIMSYIRIGGYDALKRALSGGGPEEIIEMVKRSGLRGRGGAGFPAGIKWELCRKEPGEIKYVICNADEGDPGAYMDRSILESNPHSIIEGMIIGAYAMGANQGWIYVRMEYPLAVKHISLAMEQAREIGLLGENILGSGFSFDIKVAKGAGAFVCGEETALIASIEGKRGVPRPKPPFPAQEGLWGRPTNINNVETWATVPIIIEKGPDWFAGIGTEKSKGTKIFSLVGKVENTGLVEVPMGMTLRDIVYTIGGGIKGGKRFKAIQIGGPSGGCVPPEHLDKPVDYEELVKIGSMMGSGGMIVVDEDTCMVDFAKYFLNFLKDESCGKCNSCREGIIQMHGIITDITEGKACLEDIETLHELAKYVKVASLCQLGKTSSNPALTTLTYFSEEYMEHIVHGRCRASVCSELFDAPCVNRCPADTNVPGYIQLIKEGRMFEAYDLNREYNPFPAVCGRVCPHPCEDRCKRGEFDSSLSIELLKRGCADHVFQNRSGYDPKMKVLEDTGKKVAIIGGGPAGLTAAYFLRRLGHSPTVFEATQRLGGMLVWGIPAYRLPRDLIEQEIEDILSLGVDVKLNTGVGKDVPFDEVRSGFDAVFISVGAVKETALGITGEDAKGVHSGLKMLHDHELDGTFPVGKHVVVIGGGNAAVDSARTALRLGAKATIVYRRGRKDMPAFKEEIEEAQSEGVELLEMASPKKVIVKDGKVAGLECVKTRGGEFDNSGRRKPVVVEGSEFVLDADTIIVSIGQQPDTSSIPASCGLEIRSNGQIVVDQWQLDTKVEGVFAGGDAIRGPDIVISAIGDGRRAAGRIDEYLMGESRLKQLMTQYRYDMTPPGAAEKMERLKPEMLPVKQRGGNFQEVVLQCDEEALRKEASRCLRCDIKEITE